MTSPSDWLETALASGHFVALPLSFVGGLAMGLNPCCVALYPAAAATCCAGACGTPSERMPLSRAAAFVLGTATATTILGVVAALAGRAMTGVGGWSRYVIALVPIIMGAHLLGLVRVPMPNVGSASVARRGIAGAFVSGLLLSLVMSPCGTPALAAILSYAVFEGKAAYGGALLFAYGLGNGIPVLVLGAAAAGLAARLARAGWLRWVERGSGAVLVAVGAYLVWVG